MEGKGGDGSSDRHPINFLSIIVYKKTKVSGYIEKVCFLGYDFIKIYYREYESDIFLSVSISLEYTSSIRMFAIFWTTPSKYIIH